MATLMWEDGREFPLVDRDDMLVTEAKWVEKQSGVSFTDLMFTDLMLARTLVTLRRNGIMLTWSDADGWKMGWVAGLVRRDKSDPEPPEDGDEAVPPTTGAEAGPSTSALSTSTTSGGSGF